MFSHTHSVRKKLFQRFHFRSVLDIRSLVNKTVFLCCFIVSLLWFVVFIAVTAGIANGFEQLYIAGGVNVQQDVIY